MIRPTGNAATASKNCNKRAAALTFKALTLKHTGLLAQKKPRSMRNLDKIEATIAEYEWLAKR